jgi:hypothetical protein
MQSTEQTCTFLVTADTRPASASEIKASLESGDPDAVRSALQAAIGALLAGEPLPGLFITLVRYVLPSEDHAVQKLLLLYLVRARACPFSGAEMSGPTSARSERQKKMGGERARCAHPSGPSHSAPTVPIPLPTGNDQEDG